MRTLETIKKDYVKSPGHFLTELVETFDKEEVKVMMSVRFTPIMKVKRCRDCGDVLVDFVDVDNDEVITECVNEKCWKLTHELMEMKRIEDRKYCRHCGDKLEEVSDPIGAMPYQCSCPTCLRQYDKQGMRING